MSFDVNGNNFLVEFQMEMVPLQCYATWKVIFAMHCSLPFVSSDLTLMSRVLFQFVYISGRLDALQRKNYVYMT
jgi:hypothetical protein